MDPHAHRAQLVKEKIRVLHGHGNLLSTPVLPHCLDIDMVLTPELPAPECTMTAWSLVRAIAGWTLKYRGTEHTNASGFLGALVDAQEKKDVQWLTPISGHSPSLATS